MNANLVIPFMGRSLGAVVLWAMIPLTVWASRPYVGCFCSDGHFEVLCPKIFQSKLAKPSCCHGSSARDCCSQQRDLGAGSQVQGEGSCRCMFVANSTPTKTSPVQKLPSVFTGISADVVAVLSESPRVATLDNWVQCIDTGPPPDLVVVFRHFVI